MANVYLEKLSNDWRKPEHNCCVSRNWANDVWIIIQVHVPTKAAYCYTFISDKTVTKQQMIKPWKV